MEIREAVQEDFEIIFSLFLQLQPDKLLNKEKIKLLNQIRAMLSNFGITTSHIQLRKQKGRQFHGRFYIKGKENLHKFYNEFSFLYASEKQEVLEELIFTNRREKRDDLVNTR